MNIPAEEPREDPQASTRRAAPPAGYRSCRRNRHRARRRGIAVHAVREGRVIPGDTKPGSATRNPNRPSLDCPPEACVRGRQGITIILVIMPESAPVVVREARVDARTGRMCRVLARLFAAVLGRWRTAAAVPTASAVPTRSSASPRPRFPAGAAPAPPSSAAPCARPPPPARRAALVRGGARGRAPTSARSPGRSRQARGR